VSLACADWGRLAHQLQPGLSPHDFAVTTSTRVRFLAPLRSVNGCVKQLCQSCEQFVLDKPAVTHSAVAAWEACIESGGRPGQVMWLLLAMVPGR
jgi:hypothetical protein